MTIENIKELMDGVDIAELLPDLQTLLAAAPGLIRLLVLLGPVVMLFLGLHYFLLAPKEANYTTGYRFYWGMGSVESWQFMQKLAGSLWSLLGIGLLIGMSISTGGFGEMEIMPLLWTALRRLGLQALLLLICCIIIDVVVIVRYDFKGRRRKSLQEEYE